MTALSIFSPLTAWRRKERPIEVRALRTLIRRELRDALRNRWFILYAVAFAAIAVGMAYLSQLGSGMSGLAGFGKTAAGLVNLVLLIVPLMGLTLGAMNLTGEREHGTLAYMLAQPVSRTEVLLAKFIGQGAAFAGAIAIGFGASAAMLARSAGDADGWIFLRLAALTVLLALIMLALGMLIATIVRRASAALGVAVFTWLGVVFLSDLGLMGATILFRMRASEMLIGAIANPVQAFKLASISGFDTTLDLLGPAGLYAVQTLGPWLVPILIASLVAWVVIPLGAAMWIFTRRPL